MTADVTFHTTRSDIASLVLEASVFEDTKPVLVSMDGRTNVERSAIGGEDGLKCLASRLT